MNIKCGIDIISITRIEDACKNPKFLQKILLPSEKKYVEGKTGKLDGKEVVPYNTIAGLFAAKEAVSKALGTGLMRGIGFFDIEIGHNNGEPFVVLSKKAKKIIEGDFKVAVSIAHDGDFATANCVIFAF